MEEISNVQPPFCLDFLRVPKLVPCPFRAKQKSLNALILKTFRLLKSRGWENRTPTKGFGDPYHTIWPIPYIIGIVAISSATKCIIADNILFVNSGDGGIWTLAPVTRSTAFRVRTLQPLGYISISQNCLKHVLLYSLFVERSILFFVDAKRIL